MIVNDLFQALILVLAIPIGADWATRTVLHSRGFRFRSPKLRLKFFCIWWGLATVSDAVDYLVTGDWLDIPFTVWSMAMTIYFYRRWKNENDDDPPPRRRRAGVNLLPKPRIARPQVRW